MPRSHIRLPTSTRRLPTLAALQSFVAAGHFGSVSKAADHLCRTQGAVSRQIQQLEAHYRCALFVRHASGLTLTAEGQALQAVAVDVLARLVESMPIYTLQRARFSRCDYHRRLRSDGCCHAAFGHQ